MRHSTCQRLRRFVPFALLASATLAFLIFVGAWVRSHWARDKFSWWSVSTRPFESSWTDRSLMTGLGQLRIDYRSSQTTGPIARTSSATPGFRHEAVSPTLTYSRFIHGRAPALELWGFVFDFRRTFEFEADIGASHFVGWYCVIPLWFPTTVTGFIVIGSAVRPLSAVRRSNRRCCTVCGYDLRASPDRCPECGAIKPKSELP